MSDDVGLHMTRSTSPADRLEQHLSPKCVVPPFVIPPAPLASSGQHAAAHVPDAPVPHTPTTPRTLVSSRFQDTGQHASAEGRTLQQTLSASKQTPFSSPRRGDVSDKTPPTSRPASASSRAAAASASSPSSWPDPSNNTTSSSRSSSRPASRPMSATARDFATPSTSIMAAAGALTAFQTAHSPRLQRNCSGRESPRGGGGGMSGTGLRTAGSTPRSSVIITVTSGDEGGGSRPMTPRGTVEDLLDAMQGEEGEARRAADGTRLRRASDSDEHTQAVAGHMGGSEPRVSATGSEALAEAQITSREYRAAVLGQRGSIDTHLRRQHERTEVMGSLQQWAANVLTTRLEELQGDSSDLEHVDADQLDLGDEGAGAGTRGTGTPSTPRSGRTSGVSLKAHFQAAVSEEVAARFAMIRERWESEIAGDQLELRMLREQCRDLRRAAAEHKRQAHQAAKAAGAPPPSGRSTPAPGSVAGTADGGGNEATTRAKLEDLMSANALLEARLQEAQRALMLTQQGVGGAGYLKTVPRISAEAAADATSHDGGGGALPAAVLEWEDDGDQDEPRLAGPNHQPPPTSVSPTPGDDDDGSTAHLPAAAEASSMKRVAAKLGSSKALGSSSSKLGQAGGGNGASSGGKSGGQAVKAAEAAAQVAVKAADAAVAAAKAASAAAAKEHAKEVGKLREEVEKLNKDLEAKAAQLLQKPPLEASASPETPLHEASDFSSRPSNTRAGSRTTARPGSTAGGTGTASRSRNASASAGRPTSSAASRPVSAVSSQSSRPPARAPPSASPSKLSVSAADQQTSGSSSSFGGHDAADAAGGRRAGVSLSVTGATSAAEVSELQAKLESMQHEMDELRRQQDMSLAHAALMGIPQVLHSIEEQLLHDLLTAQVNDVPLEVFGQRVQQLLRSAAASVAGGDAPCVPATTAGFDASWPSGPASPPTATGVNGQASPSSGALHSPPRMLNGHSGGDTMLGDAAGQADEGGQYMSAAGRAAAANAQVFPLQLGLQHRQQHMQSRQFEAGYTALHATRLPVPPLQAVPPHGNGSTHVTPRGAGGDASQDGGALPVSHLRGHSFAGMSPRSSPRGDSDQSTSQQADVPCTIGMPVGEGAAAVGDSDQHPYGTHASHGGFAHSLVIKGLGADRAPPPCGSMLHSVDFVTYDSTAASNGAVPGRFNGGVWSTASTAGPHVQDAVAAVGPEAAAGAGQAEHFGSGLREVVYIQSVELEPRRPRSAAVPWGKALTSGRPQSSTRPLAPPARPMSAAPELDSSQHLPAVTRQPLMAPATAAVLQRSSAGPYGPNSQNGGTPAPHSAFGLPVRHNMATPQKGFSLNRGSRPQTASREHQPRASLELGSDYGVQISQPVHPVTGSRHYVPTNGLMPPGLGFQIYMDGAPVGSILRHTDGQTDGGGAGRGDSHDDAMPLPNNRWELQQLLRVAHQTMAELRESLAGAQEELVKNTALRDELTAEVKAARDLWVAENDLSRSLQEQLMQALASAVRR